MKVSAMMSSPVYTIAPDESLTTARDRFDELNIRHLFVVDGHGALMGVLDEHRAAGVGKVAEQTKVIHAVAREDDDALATLTRKAWTQQDVIAVVDAHHRPIGVVTEHDQVSCAAKVLPEEPTVEQLASTSLVRANATATVRDALQLVTEKWVRHLLVTHRQTLLGVLSIRDLRLADPGAKLQDLLQPVQWTIGWDTPQREAAQIMARHRIGCLPIVDDDDPSIVQGLVTRTDIVRALLHSERLV